MLTLAQLTDLHLRPPGVLTLGRVDADKFVTAAIDRVVRNHPEVDAVLVTGDITDLGEEDAYARATMLLSRFSAPVIAMPGNHDRTGALKEAFRAFPGFGSAPVPHKACSVHQLGEVAVIAIDTSVDKVDEGVHHGEIGADQLAWLDETLGTCGPALIAMHHPPFAVGIGFMDAIPLTDAEAFRNILARHDNVVRIVCGHVHRTIIGEVAGVPAIAVPGVAHQVLLALGPDAEPQLVMEPPAYGIHVVDGGAAVSHVGYVEDFGPPLTFAAGVRSAAPQRRR
jgi:3',5'-cyclic AMP phosphodiesterase CpdA